MKKEYLPYIIVGLLVLAVVGVVMGTRAIQSQSYSGTTQADIQKHYQSQRGGPAARPAGGPRMGGGYPGPGGGGYGGGGYPGRGGYGGGYGGGYSGGYGGGR